ncbi:MAG: OB-fold nucleic acid binding domain-containing protein, partial [Cellulosilyticaceae bacterium]
MQTTSIRHLYQGYSEKGSQSVTVAGWVRTVRDSKTFGFIELNDGTFFKGVQIVFDDQLANFKDIAKLGVGAAIIVTGELILTPAQKQPFEIKAVAVEIEGACPAEYPLQKKRH